MEANWPGYPRLSCCGLKVIGHQLGPTYLCHQPQAFTLTIKNPNLPFGNPNPAPVTAVVEADDFNGWTEIFIDGVLEFQTRTPFVNTLFNLSPGIHTILFRYRTPANAWILKSYQFCVRSGDPTQEGCTQ